MNPFKLVWNLTSTVLTIALLLGSHWYVFKLGYQARENPIVAPFASLVVGNNQPASPKQKNCHQLLVIKLGDCD
ncbi:MAG: hypothetical protein KME46_21775 [Brasilonema angustatum HA4187-MV1]|jgi:hypothetical protein|nr:hypothetical protein [Brasilonema angustatum HA4187-MV1]